MNERIQELAIQAGGVWKGSYVKNANGDSVWTEQTWLDPADMDLHKFAMLVIKDYKTDVRESRRAVKSALGYSRIGRNNV